MFVDALCMQLVLHPERFEVIVTNNMFGDIVSDLAAALQGGLGMAASGSINPQTGHGLFEPVHGSAPKYAGKDVANPLGAILTAGLMYEHMKMTDEARLIEGAVRKSIKENQTTRDLGGNLGTRAVGDFVARTILSAG